MNLFKFKKWYFDCITLNDDVIYIYIIQLRYLGLSYSKIITHLIRPGGSLIEHSFPVKIKTDNGLNNLTLSNGQLHCSDNELSLKLQQNNLFIHLNYKINPAPGAAFEQKIIPGKNKKLDWTIIAADSLVKGRVKTNDYDKIIVGGGYIDYVYTDIPVWNLPIAELRWGRIHTETITAVFDFVKFNSNEEYKYLLIIEENRPNASNERTKSISEFNDFKITENRMSELEIHSGNIGIKLFNNRTIFNAPVFDERRIDSKLLFSLLAKNYRNVVEKKYAADAEISISNKSSTGKAIFEKVRIE